jgi:dsDNA-specific endonuclease/ATPase MutS2
MKFKIGDKVRFLNERGEGIVTKIINKTTVGVTIEEGFEIPYVVSELVSVFDGTITASLPANEIAEEPSVTYTSPASTRKETSKGIFLALSPEKADNLARSDFNIWLINHTAFNILYCVSLLKNKGYELFDKGEAKPFESKLIETISKKNIDEFNTLKVDVLFYNEKAFEHEPPVSEIVKIKPFKLYKENAFADNELIPERAMIINVSDLEKDLYFDKPESANTDLSKLLFQKNKPVDQTKKSKPHRINNASFEMEIDLHIEELIDNYGGMSNAEIIQVQLRHFQKAVDKAINEHYRSLTVIHGIGNGRLKQEVRAILSSMRLRFHDASYSKYGFGATEVVF